MNPNMQRALEQSSFSADVVNFIVANIGNTTEERMRHTIIAKPLLEKLGHSEWDIARIAINISKDPIVKILRFLSEAITENGIDIEKAEVAKVEKLCVIARQLAEHRAKAAKVVAGLFPKPVQINAAVASGSEPASEKLQRGKE